MRGAQGKMPKIVIVNTGSVRGRGRTLFLNAENTRHLGLCKVFVRTDLHGCVNEKIMIP